MKKPKILVIGLSGQSIFMEVDEFHQRGETIKAKSMHIEPGGKGFNQAFTMQKLGANCAFLTAIADDEYGKVIENEINKHFIESKIIKRKKSQTAIATILTNKKGENQVTVFPGVNALITINDIDAFETYIKESDFVLIQLEIALDITKRIVEIANKHRVKIIINPAPMDLKAIDLLKDAWLITPNEIEAKTLFNIGINANLEELKNAIKKSPFKRLVVTLGSKGSLCYENDLFTLIPSVQVGVADTTGAGDIYTAALCIQIINGVDLIEACKYASRVASVFIGKKYVIDALLNFEG